MMVTISKQTTMKLEDVSILKIKDHTIEKIGNRYGKLEVELINENEITLLTNYLGNDTRIKFGRKPHRPLELDITVEYRKIRAKQATFTNQLVKFVGTILIGFSLVYVLFFSGIGIFSRIFTQSTLLFLLVLSFILIALQLTPEEKKQSYKKKENQLEELLNNIKNILKQLVSDGKNLAVKCWNCFKEIDRNDNHCSYCGKDQQ